jgi:hypothetical protein
MTGRRAVALLIGVDHHGAPARSAQHQRSTQTGRAAADDSAFPLTKHGPLVPRAGAAKLPGQDRIATAWGFSFA